MGQYLDFDKEEKGYEPFELTKDNIRKNIGRTICYVDRVDRHRGHYTVQYGIIHSIYYSRLFLNDMEKEVDIRDVKECGIKTNTAKPE